MRVTFMCVQYDTGGTAVFKWTSPKIVCCSQILDMVECWGYVLSKMMSERMKGEEQEAGVSARCGSGWLTVFISAPIGWKLVKAGYKTCNTDSRILCMHWLQAQIPTCQTWQARKSGMGVTQRKPSTNKCFITNNRALWFVTWSQTLGEKIN